MKKRVIIIFLVLCTALASIILLYLFLLGDNTPDQEIITKFNHNADKFENVRNYFKIHGYEFYNCEKEGKELKIYYSEPNKNGQWEHYNIKIEDKEVLKQLEFIMFNLGFESIESIADHTRFVFRGKDGYFEHLQSIDYSLDNEIEKIKGWQTTNLKDNWYYLSIWVKFIRENHA